MALPLEIRQQILEETVGRSLVHYKICDRRHVIEPSGFLEWPFEDTRRVLFASHHICDLTPSAPFDHSTLDSKGMYQFRVPDCKKGRWSLDLNVLLANHQLYTEAARLVWKTNVFFFEDVLSWLCFCKNTQLLQRENLTSLHFCLRMYSKDDEDEWRKVPARCNIQDFTGLKHLSLDLEIVSSRKAWWVLKHFRITIQSRVSFLLHFRTLPLQTVTVRLNSYEDSKRHKWYPKKAPFHVEGIRLTEEEKTKYGGILEKVLLDKEDVEVPEADEETFLELKELQEQFDRGNDITGELRESIAALPIEDREDY